VVAVFDVLPVSHQTDSNKAQKEKQQPVAWLHPSFIHHQTPDGRGIAPFASALPSENIVIIQSQLFHHYNGRRSCFKFAVLPEYAFVCSADLYHWLIVHEVTQLAAFVCHPFIPSVERIVQAAVNGFMQDFWEDVYPSRWNNQSDL